MAHIAKLFYPQANQRAEDPFKELNFDEILAVHKMDQPTKFKAKNKIGRHGREETNLVKFSSISDMFKI